MDEDEEIKQDLKKELNYEEFSVEELLNEIKELNSRLKYLENLLKEKKSGQNQADKLFKK